jgi:hypothetical protein
MRVSSDCSETMQARKSRVKYLVFKENNESTILYSVNNPSKAKKC